MTSDIFVGARAKIDRARGFVEELEAFASSYQASDPVTAKINFDQNPPRAEISWRGVGEIPGCIVGDAIHNLRTALDLMASEMARSAGKSDKNVYFPFGDTAANFEEQIGRKNFDRCGQPAVDLLRSLKPYRGGDDDLRAMHDLDIQDKHKTLIVTPSAMSVQFVGQYTIDGSDIGHATAKLASFDLIFPDDSEFSGKPIAGTINLLIAKIDSILAAFAAL